MTCPKCGSQPQTDQKFCRSCGASLQVTTQPLSAPVTVSNPERTSTVSNNEKDDGVNFMRWGPMIMFLGVAIGIVGKMLVGADSITVFGVLISLAGMFLTVYPYLSRPSRKSTESNISAQPAEYLSKGGGNEYVPSITERTTDLLKTSVPVGSVRKENDPDSTS